MKKKADILPIDDCSRNGPDVRSCRACSELDVCDECRRKLCKYRAVEVYQNGKHAEMIICTFCAAKWGWNAAEIATGAIDIGTGLAGEAIKRAAE